MTTRLQLYNDALLELSERKLQTLSDLTPSRRYLDQAWDGGAVDKILSAGQWLFATRAVQLDAEDDVEPLFGHVHAFAIPTDHIRTTSLSTDEFFGEPLLNFEKGTGYWFASVDPIYLRYVSNDSSYGGDLTKWPPKVCDYAKFYLARKIVNRLTGNQTSVDKLDKAVRKSLTEAQSVDAMEGAVTFPPPGRLVRARWGGRGGWDRGSQTRLIG